jgi:hypothetical protein
MKDIIVKVFQLKRDLRFTKEHDFSNVILGHRNPTGLEIAGFYESTCYFQLERVEADYPEEVIDRMYLDGVTSELRRTDKPSPLNYPLSLGDLMIMDDRVYVCATKGFNRVIK